MGYHVYRFLDDNLKVIYIGMTSQSMSSRMNGHFGGGGHLPQECYNSVNRIDYIELLTANDMKIKEIYYISKYNPKYNVKDVGECTLEIPETHDAWVQYFKKDKHNLSYLLESERQKYEDDIDIVRRIADSLEKRLSKTERELAQKESALNSLREMYYAKKEEELAILEEAKQVNPEVAKIITKKKVENPAKMGRPKADSSLIVKALNMYDSGIYTVSIIEKETGISKATLYRRLSERDRA